jgi:hypothetical protein
LALGFIVLKVPQSIRLSISETVGFALSGLFSFVFEVFEFRIHDGPVDEIGRFFVKAGKFRVGALEYLLALLKLILQKLKN